MMRTWLRIPRDAAEYATISERTFENWLKSGLRYVKVGQCRMTRPEWIDGFMMRFEVSCDGGGADQLADEILKGIS